MHYIDLVSLKLADVDQRVAYEPLDWEYNLLAYQISPDYVVILNNDCSLIAIKMSIEEMIQRFAQQHLLLESLNVASHKAADEKYAGIVAGRFQLIPSAGFEEPRKCWIMGHHLIDVHAHGQKGIVSLVFNTGQQSVHVLIDANLTSLRKRIAAVKNVAKLQWSVYQSVQQILGFSEHHHQTLVEIDGPDYDQVRSLICRWAIEIVATFMRRSFEATLTTKEEQRCISIASKVVTGRSLSRERQRMDKRAWWELF